MRAIVFTEYGSPDVLRLAEIERPVPADGEVLVRVHAASLNDWDHGALQGADFVNRLLFGVLKPKKGRQVLGSDVAGRIEAVGRGVRRFRPGDDVFGDLSGRWGGFAEFVCAPEEALALKAPGMTFEQAAAIPQAALLAVQALRDLGGIESGQRILVNGAGGGVGTFALQIAALYDAEVTAVDAPEKLDMLRSMGARHVLDYTREDFTRAGERYDLILDVKTTRSVLDCVRALNAGGTYVTVGGSMARLFQGLLLWPWIALTTRKKIRLLALKPNKDLVFVRELFEAGKVVPVIDGHYGLADVPEAFRYFGSGRHKGKIVITVEQSDSASVAALLPSRH
ncbi:MAG TPA: NAD(P)-dependent alcohol dehydrogenase [Thermoanaerobaculia bacterium]|nr:NAD(P)-dependent alcohol dehydrogenase [Thermoanaerobaculia bacterium]